MDDVYVIEYKVKVDNIDKCNFIKLDGDIFCYNEIIEFIELIFRNVDSIILYHNGAIVHSQYKSK